MNWYSFGFDLNENSSGTSSCNCDIKKIRPLESSFLLSLLRRKNFKQLCNFQHFLRREKEEIEPKPKRNRWCPRCERTFQVLDSCSFIEVLCICIKFSSCLFLCVRQRPNQDQTRLSQQNFAENPPNKFGLSKVKEQRRRELLQWRFKRVTRILCVWTSSSLSVDILPP